MPELIEHFVQTIVQPHELMGVMNKPLAERDVLALFSPERTGVASLCSPLSPATAAARSETDEEDRDLTPQLLILFYVLCLKDATLQQRADISKSGGGRVDVESDVSLDFRRIRQSL